MTADSIAKDSLYRPPLFEYQQYFWILWVRRVTNAKSVFLMYWVGFQNQINGVLEAITCVFRNNTAREGGGAIYMEVSAQFTISYTTNDYQQCSPTGEFEAQ